MAENVIAFSALMLPLLQYFSSPGILYFPLKKNIGTVKACSPPCKMSHGRQYIFTSSELHSGAAWIRTHTEEDFPIPVAAVTCGQARCEVLIQEDKPEMASCCWAFFTPELGGDTS